MKLKIYQRIALCLSLSIVQFSHSEVITIPKAKLDKIKLDFKQISPAILKLGQSKIPNPFGKNIDAIIQILNSRELTDSNLKSVLDKLSTIKNALREMDPNTNISIQKIPGRITEQPLGNFLETTYRKFVSDLKLILAASQTISDTLSADKIKLLTDNFKPIFGGFYDLFEHSYYQYLDTVRQALHFGLNKEKLILIKDIMELLVADLNDEDQNKTMMIETAAYQKFNLTIRDFKELIKKYIGTVNSFIK